VLNEGVNMVEDIVKKLEMLPHPEGGYYKETYRSEMVEAFQGFSSGRSLKTAIYYLLEKGDFSAFHKIKSDEMWHFYGGHPLEVVEITTGGHLKKTIIGNDVLANQQPQYVVKAGHWFGSRSLGDYSLVGCTVSPGFDFQDFEMAERERLIADYPNFKIEIESFTR